jgi:hypothetical protein
MVKASIAMLVVLTALVFLALGWRERRLAAQAAKPPPRLGWLARQKARANRLLTAAAIAAVGTMLLLGGLHWLRVLQGTGGW